MEFVGAVTGILSCLCAQNCLNESIGRRCGHFRRPKRKLDKLRRKMVELKAVAVDVERKLEQMQIHGMEPTARVKLWQINVQEIEREVHSLTTPTNENRQVGLDRCYPNYFCSRIRLGEVIEEKIKEVTELIEERGQISDDSLAEKLLTRGNTLSTTQLVGNTATVQSVWGHLMDHQVGRIGVYGMGGIGKTTIMKEIHNRLLEESSRFNCVIWITVPKESNLEKLQDKIAKVVALDLSQYEDEQRSAELLNVLKRRKRFALILDNLWDSFPIEEVGIPVPTPENGCKVVITTRSLGICRGMETDREVEVKRLSDNEAWDLFSDKVGEQVLRSQDTQAYARDVVKECGGLPLAIITVGRALRNTNDISEWENALAELRSSTANVGRMEEVVFVRLRFSYAKLRDDTSRSCFLCCALYPEGHQIDANELIEYWMWEGLLGDVGRIQANKRKGKFICNELKNACLLESVTEHGVEYVRMHDMIRDMAISITSTRPRCIIKAGIGLRKAPGSDEWTEDVERVSLMRNDVKTIPFNPWCPRLTSLLLEYNSLSEQIPHSFFDFMLALKFLNLSYTGIEFLPDSLSNLENLCSLLSTNCWNLKKVPSLLKLVKLKVLDLSDSRQVQELPHGMEQLQNLRRLNLSNTSVENIPKGSLAAFTLLEELSMDGVYFSRRSNSDRPNIEEVISSTNLSMLEVKFEDLGVFDFYVRSGHWEQLEKYKFIVGDATGWLHEKRSIAIGGSFLMRGSPVLLPTNSWELHLEFCDDIVWLSMCLSNLMQLKACTIRFCSEMLSIVKSGENNLSTLERMKLAHLKNLRMICEGVVEPLTLSSLKIIELASCDNLKCLFFGGLLQQLQNLEEIIVIDCAEMGNIMLDDTGTSNAAIVNFPRLQKLKLISLPKLKSIYNGVIVCESLQSIEVRSCHALKRLPLALGVDPVQQQLSPPPALKEIKGTIDWWESLDWDTPDAKIIMQPFFLQY